MSHIFVITSNLSEKLLQLPIKSQSDDLQRVSVSLRQDHCYAIGQAHG